MLKCTLGDFSCLHLKREEINKCALHQSKWETNEIPEESKKKKNYLTQWICENNRVLWILPLLLNMRNVLWSRHIVSVIRLADYGEREEKRRLLLHRSTNSSRSRWNNKLCNVFGFHLFCFFFCRGFHFINNIVWYDSADIQTDRQWNNVYSFPMKNVLEDEKNPMLWLITIIIII